MGDCPRCHASGKELFSQKRYDKDAVDAELKKMSSKQVYVPLALPVYTWTYYGCEACGLVFTESS